MARCGSRRRAARRATRTAPAARCRPPSPPGSRRATRWRRRWGARTPTCKAPLPRPTTLRSARGTVPCITSMHCGAEAMPETPKITVIGAGVAGLACATELQKRGAEVTVVERAAGIGPASCSWWAGGMLAPWCEAESAEEAVVRLGTMAADWWERHAGGVTRRGTLVVAPARDAAELTRFARRTETFERLDGEAVAALEPELAGRYRSGLFFKDEAHLDPRRATQALAARLRDGGAALLFGVDAEDAPTGDVTVDCRGLAA